MKKGLFKQCVNAVIKHVFEEFKEEIQNQLDLISFDDGLWNVEGPLYYLKESMTLLNYDLLFLCWINEGVDAYEEMKDGMYTTLYEEDSNYGFDAP